ncbi:MAG TPA: heparin lyase I family protein [Solirubrobacterales bacterium]|nr:heparin lyase I family protein [Solirubrobacterales bacterium]
MGNGFPGPAVVSTIALLVALGLAALLSLQPWAANSVAPQLSVAPGLGIGLGDSAVVSRGRQFAVAPAQPATGAAPRLIAAGVAVDKGESQPRLGIATARVVASPRPGAPSQGSPQSPQPEPMPVPQPAPVPVAVPVATPPPSVEPVAAAPTRGVGGGGSSGPVGAGTGSPEGAAEPVEVHAGDEYAFAFSFYVQPIAYRAPGDENLIMRFRGDGSESPSFGLQLWDDGSGAQRGLWASGDAMGGERFLSPLAEGAWHEAVLCFKASSEDDGFYVLLLDGQPVDAQAWVSLIDPGSSDAQIEVGLFREGEPVVGTADVLFGPTKLGDTLGSVVP